MITASIVGATGYTGAVLTDILAEHPEVRLGALTSKSYVGQRVDRGLSPPAGGRRSTCAYSPETAGAVRRGLRLLPARRGPSRWWPSWSTRGCRVVDLSADYRLKDPRATRRGTASSIRGPTWWPRPCSGCPRSTGSRSPTARIVANPGCYPTSMLLGAAARGRRHRRRRRDRRLQVRRVGRGADALGRRPTSARWTTTSGPTARSATGTPPRWSRNWPRRPGSALPVSFTPHLLPVDRGILSTMLLPPAERLERERRLAGEVPDVLRGRAVRGGDRRSARAWPRWRTPTSAASPCGRNAPPGW